MYGISVFFFFRGFGNPCNIPEIMLSSNHVHIGFFWAINIPAKIKHPDDKKSITIPIPIPFLKLDAQKRRDTV